VSLNLHYAETEDFTNLDKFLKWFCVSVGQSLRMPNQLADYWDERFSTSKMNCTAYFEEYLLASSDSHWFYAWMKWSGFFLSRSGF
jgi:hypothetical protein